MRRGRFINRNGIRFSRSLVIVVKDYLVTTQKNSNLLSRDNEEENNKVKILQ